MTDLSLPPARYAPAIELPPYSYVPGHDLPHPVNDPAGHLHAPRGSAPESPISADTLAALPTDPTGRRSAVADLLAGHFHWLHALDLFNGGFYWEAHEAWEGFWHALGRTTPEARFVQGLIHVAAAAVKIREGKPAGVHNHTGRARDLLGDRRDAKPGGRASCNADTLGLSPQSIARVLDELEIHRPECWHTSRCPVVRVLVTTLRISS